MLEHLRFENCNNEKAGLKLSIQKTKIMASGPIISWQIDGGKVETMTCFIFLGSKITADGNCSHEIKGCLFLERKAMTSLDSILKSRDITLPTKFCVAKTMFFSSSHVLMWELGHKDGWAPTIDAFELWYWRRLLRVSWTARRSNQSILKEVSPDYSLEGLMLMLKLPYFGHLMRRVNSLEKTLRLGKTEGRRRSGWQKVRWLEVITESMDMSVSQLGDSEVQESLACCSPWGCKESDMM